MKLPRTFIGWTNIKWLIKELIKMYSSASSFFSKKRFESGVAFAIGQFGMVYYIVKKIDSMDYLELATWAGIEFLIAGYVINQIQKEKKVQ